MKRIHDDPFTVNLPHLDLHGETRESSTFLINSFIKDNYKIGNINVVIIHGKSGDVLKRNTREVLKNNIYVKEFHIDMFNDGQTIVSLKRINNDTKS